MLRPQNGDVTLLEVFKWVLRFLALVLGFFYNSWVHPGCLLEAGVVGRLWLDSEFKVFTDFLSGVYGFMLLCCGLCVLGFCIHYFGGWGACADLLCLLVVFLGVMVRLTFRGSLMLSLVL